VNGVSGFFEFLSAQKNLNHEEQEIHREWCGGEYDSEKFNTCKVNWELIKYLRWSRGRSRPWQERP
jgi:hypothetical protein